MFHTWFVFSINNLFTIMYKNINVLNLKINNNVDYKSLKGKKIKLCITQISLPEQVKCKDVNL